MIAIRPFTGDFQKKIGFCPQRMFRKSEPVLFVVTTDLFLDRRRQFEGFQPRRPGNTGFMDLAGGPGLVHSINKVIQFRRQSIFCFQRNILTGDLIAGTGKAFPANIAEIHFQTHFVLINFT